MAEEVAQLAPEVEAPPPLDARSLNVPNTLTTLRLVLSFVLFWLIDIEGWWRTSAVLFLVAASTDWMDGYYARRYHQITVLGRILDPFVDKVIICGSFIFLLGQPTSGVTAWMTLIIVGREMFVTNLRVFLEKRGIDFSAKWSGKIKMVLQCVAVTAVLLALSPEFTGWWDTWIAAGTLAAVRDLILWATVAVTVYSGAEYTYRGFRLLQRAAG
jgi:CDP-diacylglycerol---glycerol-3-phosphate 3-phosphatidyltransferase